MNRSAQYQQAESAPISAADVSCEPAMGDSGGADELAKYLPHFTRMSKQLKVTSKQIEDSVVGVCNSFQGIAERTKSTFARTASFLSPERSGLSAKQSFEGLIANCSKTLVKILNVTEESGEVSRRAIDR